MFDLLTYEKGGSCSACSSCTSGPTSSATGCALPQGPRVRQHGHLRPVGRARGCYRRPVATMDTWILQGGHPLVSLSGETSLRSRSRSVRHRRAPSPPSATEWNVLIVVRALRGADAPRRRSGTWSFGATPGKSRGGRPDPGGGERRWPGHVPGRLRAGTPLALSEPRRAHRVGAFRSACRHVGHHARRPLGTGRLSHLASRLGAHPDPASWAPVGSRSSSSTGSPPAPASAMR